MTTMQDARGMGQTAGMVIYHEQPGGDAVALAMAEARSYRLTPARRMIFVGAFVAEFAYRRGLAAA